MPHQYLTQRILRIFIRDESAIVQFKYEGTYLDPGSRISIEGASHAVKSKYSDSQEVVFLPLREEIDNSIAYVMAAELFNDPIRRLLSPSLIDLLELALVSDPDTKDAMKLITGDATTWGELSPRGWAIYESILKALEKR